MEKSELMDSDFDKDDNEEILVGSRDKVTRDKETNRC